MPETSSGKPEKPERIAKVTQAAALDMKGAILTLAGPRRDSDTREAMIARAARRAGISFRQAKSLFYGESSDPRNSVVEKVRLALGGRRSSIFERQEDIARDEYQTIGADLVALAINLAALDEDVVREALAEALPALVAEIRRTGGTRAQDAREGSSDRSLDRGE